MSIVELINRTTSRWPGAVAVPQGLDVGIEQNIGESFELKLFGFTDNPYDVNYVFKSESGGVIEDREKVSKVKELMNGYNNDTGRLIINKKEYNAGIFKAYPCYLILEKTNLESLAKGNISGMVVEMDIQDYIKQLPSQSTIQVPSNFNALANVDKWTSHYEGIENYKKNPSLASKAALSCVSSTLVRNYSIPELYSGQYNALSDIALSHQNGFLVWSDRPEDIMKKIEDSGTQWDDLRIPIIMNVDVDCVKLSRDKLTISRRGNNINMILIASPVYNRGGNGGKIEAQEYIIRTILDMSYLSAILLSLNMHIANKVRAKPIVHLTLIEDLELWSIDAIAKALDKLGVVDININIVLDPSNKNRDNVLRDISTKLGIGTKRYERMTGGSPFPKGKTPAQPPTKPPVQPTQPRSPPKQPTPAKPPAQPTKPLSPIRSPPKQPTPAKPPAQPTKPLSPIRSPPKQPTPAKPPAQPTKPLSPIRSPPKQPTPKVEEPKPSLGKISEKSIAPDTGRSMAYKKGASTGRTKLKSKVEKYNESLESNNPNDYLLFDPEYHDFAPLQEGESEALQAMLQYNERNMNSVTRNIDGKDYTVTRHYGEDGDYIYTISYDGSRYSLINVNSPWISNITEKKDGFSLYDSTGTEINEYPFKDMNIQLQNDVPVKASIPNASNVEEYFQNTYKEINRFDGEATDMGDYVKKNMYIANVKNRNLSNMRIPSDNDAKKVIELIGSGKNEIKTSDGTIVKKERIPGDRLDYFTFSKNGKSDVLIPFFSEHVEAPGYEGISLMGLEGEITQWPLK